MQLSDLKGLNIHIVGLSGIEGSTITEFLWKNNIRKLTTHDFCEEKLFAKNFKTVNPKLKNDERKEKISFLKHLPITKNFKESYLNKIEEADLIFTGQAWYNYQFNYPKLKNAYNNNIPFKTIINLYLDLFKGVVIGVTGSNGKTTTSAITHHLLKNTYKKGDVYLSGNERSGGQMLNNILNTKKEDLLILEISNRQLKLLGTSKVDIAAVTNITENHLHEHTDYNDYANTKLAICNNAKHIILNNFDEKSVEYAAKNLNAEKIIWFNNKKILTEFDLIKTDLKIPGKHNIENLYTSLAILKALNIANVSLKNTVQLFQSVKKRLEIIGEKNGVTIVNDLSSTTPVSTIAALKAFENSTFSLVLGGNDKGGSFDELIKLLKELLKKQQLKNLFLLPGNIRKIIQSHNIDNTLVESFEEISKHTNKILGKYLIISPAGEKVISIHLKNSTLKKIFS